MMKFQLLPPHQDAHASLHSNGLDDGRISATRAIRRCALSGTGTANLTASRGAIWTRRSLYISTALVTVLSPSIGIGPARAQSVTGSGNLYSADTGPSENPIPTPPIPAWIIPNENLYIGITSAGTLNITGGGTVSNKAALVGNIATGTILVTGTSSSWINSGSVQIGDGGVPGFTGTGILTVEDGGKVSNTNGFLGYYYTGVGIATISGSDTSGNASTWENSQQLQVGRYGSGTLNILNGGFVSNTGAYIGTYADGTGTGKGTVTVSGADGNGHDSTWQISGDFVVGYQGNGTVEIKDGGKVSNTGDVALGYLYSNDTFVGSTGDVTVSGSGSTWANSGELTVGNYGTGTLKVEDGGQVLNTNAYIGYYGDLGGTSSATISGSGSTWKNTGDLYVGDFGSGMLVIDKGGAVSNVDGIIGYANTGTVTVAGADAGGTVSTWTNSGNLFVGYDSGGAGTLTIENGGEVRASAVSIATLTGSTGTLNLNGDGATGRGVLETAYVEKGSGAATLNLNGGILRATRDESDFLSNFGTLTAGTGGVWIDSNGHAVTIDADTHFAGSSTFNKIGTGTLTLTGDSSGFAGFAFVEGGTLAIAQGGKFGSSSGDIASAAGSVASATVTGAGSAWTNTGILTVGDQGNGTLTVSDGGKVSSATGYIANAAGSVSSVTVTGEDGSGNASTWTNGDLYVGFSGNGTLSVEAGGKVSSSSSVVGFSSGSEGSATVTGAGSSWTNTFDLYVGSSGIGTLSVEAGGKVSSSRGFIGYSSGTESSATVTGAGSTWTNTYNLYVGFAGNGTLTISDSGKVSSITGIIGNVASSEGSATVTGAGSSWTNASDLFVGSIGKGTLSVEAGGKVSNSRGYIGYSSHTDSSATVTGAGSTWTNMDNLYVGFASNGTLSVEAGGKVSSAEGYIGYVSGIEGHATVTGSGSTWTGTHELYVGYMGNGTLTVSDGGKVSAPSVGLATAGGNGTLNIGAAAGDAAVAAGTLDTTIVQFGDGAGTLNFNHIGDITFAAGLSSTGSGTHALNHYAGVTTLTGDSSGFTGTTTVSGGTLLVGDATGAGKLGGVVNVGTDGTLGGSGTILGATTVDGTLSAGNSPGTLTFADDLTLDSGSKSVFELNSPGIVGGTGAGGNDLVVVHGDLALGGTLDARVAAAGYYRLFNYDGTLTGTLAGGTVTGTGGFTPVTSAPDIQYGIPHQVNLSVLAAGQTMQFWDGTDTTGNGVVDGGAGTWSTAGTNWTGQPGQANINGPWGGSVGVFAGAAGGAVTVAGTQSFDTLQFSTNGYTLQGGTLALGVTGGGTLNIDNGISTTVATTIEDGAGSALRKTGNGTLILSGTNTYTGGTTLLGGVLSVSADANLGAASGAITFDGGTLATTAGFDSSRTIALTQDGRFDVASGTELGLTGVVSGSSDLIKQGGGTLRLDNGANAYGNTLVAAGTLVGNAGSIRGNIGNAGTVVFDQGSNASFAGDIAGYGGTDGTMTKRGAGILTLAGTSSLDWSIEAGGLVSASDRFGGNAAIGAGASLTFDQASTGAYAGVLSGDGRFIKAGSGTAVLSGTNTYTGGTTITGGVLSVSADANLGAALGGLTFDGGTLATTASFDSSRAITLTQAGRFDIAAGTELGLGGAVSGASDVVKLGDGTLTLTGANSYGGNTFVAAGTLVGNAGSIRGNIANAGMVVFDQAGNAGFAGDIAGLGGVNGAMVKRGAGDLTLAGTSSLDWTIEAGSLISAAERFGGNAAIQTGANLTFNQAGDAIYAGVLSGSGSFSKTGAGTLGLSADSSAFTGSTFVQTGTLAIDGKLGGTLDVGAAARLQGIGTVGNTTVNGTIAPGNGAVGTINVANITFNAGSIYEAEVNAAGQSDRIAASGTATINGGSVKVLNAPGVYTLGSRNTILSAAGGVSGRFAGLTQTSPFSTPFLSFALAYDPNAIYLDVSRSNVTFASAGQTRNQIATGDGLDTVPLSSPLMGALAQLDAPSARAAFDQLSGEIHVSAKTAIIEDSRFIRNAVNDRIRAAFDGVGASSMPVMAYGEGGPQFVPATTDRFAVWGQGFGSWGNTNGDGNAAHLNRSTGGFFIGADAPVFDTWRFGAVAGYSRSTFDVKDLGSSGWSDNYHLGLYGGTTWGALALRTGAAYTWHDIATSRGVSFPGFGDSLKGDYNAGTAQVFGELGYGIHAGNLAFEPFANLAYVSLHTDGFTERGGAAALSGQSATTDATFTTLGLRASTTFDLYGASLTVKGTLGWRHAFGDVTPLSAVRFAGSDVFTVAGVPIARDTAVVEAGLDYALSSTATLGVTYGGQFGSGATDQSFRANFNVRF